MYEDRVIGKVVSRYWKSPAPNPDEYQPGDTVIIELQ